MAVNKVDAQKDIAAPPDKVFRSIADYKQRPQWLPSNFSDYKVGDNIEGFEETEVKRTL